MSERWKYQLKTGLFWGIFMTLFNVLFEIKEKSLSEQFTSPNLYIRLVVFSAVGIFILGYFTWRAKKTSESTK
jgi:hypothetical protein